MDPCVKGVLCGLSLPVLRSLDALLVGVIGNVSSLLAQLEARSARISLLQAPLTVASNVATGVLDEALSVANILPLDLIEGCTDLGDIQSSIALNQRRAVAGAQDIADDLNRLTSLKTGLDQDIAKARADLERYASLRDVINDCIAENS